MKNRLRLIREERGLTREALAAQAEVSSVYIKKIEDEGLLPSVDVALRLAQALDVDPDQLFFRPDFGADRIAALGSLYADNLLELDEHERERVIRYALFMDKGAWKILRRGRTGWAVMQANAEAFDQYMKKFSLK